MNLSIDQVLDACLDKIRRGESLESCLTAYPMEAERLRPLLETAVSVHSIPAQQSSNAVFQKGRERMFAVIDQEFAPQVATQFAPQPVSQNALSRYSVRILTWITGKDTIDMKLITRFAIAFALVLTLIVGLGTTAVSANNALPGDLLYPLKTSAQNARLMLTWNAEARQALEQHFQEEYRNEVRTLVQDGRQVQVRFEGTLDAQDSNLWVIGGLPVSVDPATQISGNPKIGDVVLVEAAVQKDGSILASQLTLNGAVHHPEDLQVTPEHTSIHTIEPKYQQEDLAHASPTLTLLPTLMPEHPDDPTGTPSPTIVPVHPTEPVHHDDGSSCQTCGGTSGGHVHRGRG